MLRRPQKKKSSHKKAPKTTEYGKRVKARIATLIMLGYGAGTARVYAYHIEGMLKKLKKDVVLLKVGANKEKGIKERIFRATLKGYKRLQNQPPEKDTISVIKVDTKEVVEIHIKQFMKDEEMNRKKIEERMERKKRRIKAAERRRLMMR